MDPVLDPYAVPRLKELAPGIRSHGPRVHVPDNQALSRSVVTSQDPIRPAVVADTARALKVKSVAEADGKRKLQINNSGQTVTAIQPNGLPVPAAQKGQNQTMTAQERQVRIEALTAQAAQGDKSGKREIRQLQDQQRVQEKVGRRATVQAATTAQQQQKQQQKAERKAAAQQQQPPVQQQQQKQQQKAERKAVAQQQQPPVQQQLQKQQQKAERKAAAQQQQPQVQQQQQKQQQKADRKAAQQQQPPAQTSPSKADRKAAKKKNGNNSGSPNQ